MTRVLPALRPIGRRGESGMVTAELAAVLPVVVLLLAIGLGALRYGMDQVRCIDAARAAARAAARGDSPAAVQEAGRRGAPAGAQIGIVREGGLARVTVSAPPPGGGLLAALPSTAATAVADVETADAP